MLQSMKIIGGYPLFGEISISGAKNLALPAIVTTLLTDNEITLNNVPNLSDVTSLLELLEYLGCDINHDTAHKQLILKTTNIKHTEAPYDFVRKMRASILVLGPMIARFGRASVSFPGGCAIGVRAIDLHIRTLQLLGAEVTIDNGFIKAYSPNGLTGCDITFPIVTVTGTENSIMAAVLANGTTRLINAAMEPEVEELCNLLNNMGAKITGQGTSTITIEGVESLHGTTFDIMPDRIEAGTYAIASAITHGKLLLKNCIYNHLEIFFNTLKSNGVSITQQDNGVLVENNNDKINSIDISTAPYPGFPTDLQAQYMALMTISEGVSLITENLFENRLMHTQELNRMGANIIVKGNTATVKGVENLNGAPVMATDLRASASLILAGLVAKGETTVNRLYHIDRGYENIDNKLLQCGAHIKRITV
ncbi:MAG: UDP-N-acetylglucosamine 1-carboxyvinyltransferase [Alphaproteobacteria bacterium]|nr:UDP-N-acetylglucosamine 1-carboxyvinyltransferase [Alphaproteobacteria bacterium]